MKKYLLYTIVLFQIIMVTVAFAQPQPPPMPGFDLNRMWIHEDHTLARLGITDDQKNRIEILRKSLMEDLAPLRALRYEKIH